ncbi:hypothetical protein PG993_002681 [Apiospora rasikravindrae]|uniref:Auxin efflux carrier n=1 Tax=Apiospora rasikravindrae TaxID=990691 RepID=A0ABR1TXC1_9PEZI
MAPTGLHESFVGAIQASLSVLVIIACGVIAARCKILDAHNSKPISKLCVRIFLPALLLTKIGSDLEPGSAGRYGIVLVWALACHLLSFLIGLFAHHVLGMPDWTIVAVMFNNSTSYPLLLIGALADSGVLKLLTSAPGGGGESTSQSLEHAEAYLLVFSTVSNCLTFAVGPRLIDTEHAPEEHEDKDMDGARDDDLNQGDTLPNEESALLHPADALRSVNPFSSSPSSSTSIFLSKKAARASGSDALLSRPPRRRVTLVTRKQWTKIGPHARWWLTLASDFFNAPLLGALLGTTIGLVPALHRAFFNDPAEGGIFTAWLTSPLKKIGSVFVPLPVVIAGVSLYSSLEKTKSDSTGNGQGQDSESNSKLPKTTLGFILFVRFILWTGVSIGVVYGLGSHTSLLGDDPMLRFAMMLMPVGPPATKLIAMVQVSGADEGEEASIAKLLTISYLISPILSFTVVGGLMASQASL